MADKKITDLTLISSIADSLSVPGDNGIQTYRFTSAQLFTYMRTKFGSKRTITDGTGDVETTDNVILCDPTSASFTRSLPAVATFPQYAMLYFKNIAVNGNTVTLDGNSSELIEGAETLVLRSGALNSDGVMLMNTGTKWVILTAEQVRTPTIATPSSTYSVNVYDELILCSGASFTLTLPTAVGRAGKKFKIVHTGTSYTQVYSIATTSSQTINGVASGDWKLYFLGEMLEVTSNGTNWTVTSILNHDPNWTAFPSVAAGTLITGSTSNPSYGTQTYNEAFFRKIGSHSEFYWRMRQTTNGSGGSGLMLFNLPFSFTMHSDVAVSNSTSDYTSFIRNPVGELTYSSNGGSGFFMYGKISPFSNTSFKGAGNGNNVGTSAGNLCAFWNDSFFGFGGSTVGWSIDGKVKMANFR